jgi:hypothetical protein
MDRVHGSVDRAVPWSTGGTELDRSSPSGTTRHQCSPRWCGEGEGDGTELTEANIERCSGEGAPVAEKNGTRHRCSVLGGLGHG